MITWYKLEAIRPEMWGKATTFLVRTDPDQPLLVDGQPIAQHRGSICSNYFISVNEAELLTFPFEFTTFCFKVTEQVSNEDAEAYIAMCALAGK